MEIIKSEIILIYLLLMFNIITCKSARPLYKCEHNELDEINHLENIIIKNDGTEKKRRTEQPEFKDFNIVLDLENVKSDIQKYGLEYQMDFYISSMTKAVETLKTLLKVKPLETEYGGYYVNDDSLKMLNIQAWDKTKFGNEAIAKQDSFQKLGIDLAIFGTLMNLPESTLATASAQLYQPNDGQPYLGIVKINKNIDYSKPNSQIYFESILVHEFTHILGFSHHFFSNYLKQIEYKVDEDGINRIYLTSPKLLEVAKKYYACDTLEGVELENQGGNGTAGSHWEARILLGEYMNGYAYTEEQVISEFTLAVLEDLGYYKPNYYTGGLMRFGKNKGCDFLKNKCVDISTKEINPKFENEFYDSISVGAIESSCTSGRQSRAYHAWYAAEEGEEIPKFYQYFGPNIVGYLPADYCPISQSFTNEEMIYYFAGHCSKIGGQGYGTQIHYEDNIDPTSGKLLDFTGESFSDHSFCYLSSLSKDTKISKAVRANCYETFCSDRSLTIKIFDDFIVCPRAGGKIKVKGYLGYLLCPDYNLICSGKVPCNNIFDCVDNKSTVKEESYIYDYEIKTSQNIDKANSAEADETDNYELSENGKCQKFCKHCINNKCQGCASGYSLKLETNGAINCYESSLFSHGYYLNSENVYIKCIDNCNACDDLTSCTKCASGFKSSDKACVELTQEEKDRQVPNCLEYDENFKCLKCELGYGFKYDEMYTKCYSMQNELSEYYSKDNDFSFIPCSSADSDCAKCYYAKNEYRVKCTLCKDDLILLDKGKGICMNIEEIENTTKYYIVNTTHARECKKEIENCVSCDSADNCLKCKYGYVFDIIQKKCLQKSKANDGNIISGITVADSKESSENEKAKTDTSSKRRKVKKKKNSGNYLSVSKLILFQTLYIIFLLIKF